jgi:hypothetical protein
MQIVDRRTPMTFAGSVASQMNNLCGADRRLADKVAGPSMLLD